MRQLPIQEARLKISIEIKVSDVGISVDHGPWRVIVNLIAQRSIGLDKSVGVGHLQRGVSAGRTFEVEQDLLQAAKAAGASVVAVAAGREKLALVRELGADAVVDYQEVESLSAAVREATAGRGVDVVFDPVGGADAREQLRCLAWGGRYLTIGFAAGEISTVKVNQTIMKGISVIGVAYGMSAVLDPGANLEDLRQLFEWYEEGRVTPTISNRFPLVQAADAFRVLHERRVLGKVVIEMAT